MKLNSGFWPVFRPILDGLFTVHFIMILGLLSWAVVGVLEVLHAGGGSLLNRLHVSRGAYRTMVLGTLVPDGWAPFTYRIPILVCRGYSRLLWNHDFRDSVHL